MAIELFLAMTAAEFAGNTPLPPKIAWMACHFSPYGTGLSNLPRNLPEGAMVILNDRTPVCGHDPERIAEQLLELNCSSLLLDFQRPDEPETAAIVKKIVDALPCPVAVSECYAADLDCPIFLPPIPPHIPPEENLAPWQSREIWLEAALDTVQLTITSAGCKTATAEPPEALPHQDSRLFCHYHIHVTPNEIRFTLHRTEDDLQALLAAGNLGITRAVGLFQELGRFHQPWPETPSKGVQPCR